jgi:hypothetical protein
MNALQARRDKKLFYFDQQNEVYIRRRVSSQNDFQQRSSIYPSTGALYSQVAYVARSAA